MALRLLAAGYELTVYNRNRELATSNSAALEVAVRFQFECGAPPGAGRGMVE